MAQLAPSLTASRGRRRGGRPAVQGSADFLAFGLGRWACPGRQPAIHEIKILLYMFFSKFDITLKENSFRVNDTINTALVAPEASMLRKRQDDSREVLI